jgi:hypothetical protein
MNGDSGRGEVIQKNIILDTVHFAPTGVLACKHANGRDWWISVHEAYGSEFYFYLLSPNGPVYSHSQSFGYRQGFGQYNFSPNGSRFGGYNTLEDFEVFDFDRCSGLLSNFRHVEVIDSAVCMGASFSPNSKYLYGSSGGLLYQIDASSNQPDTSLYIVAEWDSFYSPNPPWATGFFLQQLAPDGKIYLSTTNSTQAMHVIANPDNPDTLCNVLQHFISLPCYNSGTMVNHPNYNLGPLMGSPCDTLTGLSEAYNQKPLAMKVFPNPVYGNELEINYSLEQNMQGTLEILNVTGKLVYEKTLPQWSSYQRLHLPELATGVYLVKLASGNKITTVKFIKGE